MTKQTYLVRFSALIDAVARVEQEAETPEEAVKLARERLDAGNDPDAVLELTDNQIDPIIGTIEPLFVDDAEGNEVLSFPVVSGHDIAALFARNEGKVPSPVGR